MLPQYRPLSNGFLPSRSVSASASPYSWKAPVGALGAAASGIVPAASFDPSKSYQGEPVTLGNDGSGDPDPGHTGPDGPNGPATNYASPGSLVSGANLASAAGGVIGSALGGVPGGALAGAAAGYAAGNSAQHSIGQGIGAMALGLATGGLGAPIGAWIGGKIGDTFADSARHADAAAQAGEAAKNDAAAASSYASAANTTNTSADFNEANMNSGAGAGGLGAGVSNNSYASAADTTNTSQDYNESQMNSGAAAGGGDGSGGDGGCVVCTTLHDHRLVEPIIYRAITSYGALVNDTTMRGYHWWGKPLARLLDRSAFARWLISPLARPVVRELAFRGGIGESTWLGRRLLGFGEIACAAVATLLKPNQGSCENCKCRLN